ncbi:MAG: YdcF family protein [Opitutae bacterium]|nr:YdcF family protein [Opitutae bacterium]MDA8823900.1 YdcF family protein [Opitutales bacterium]
MRVVRWFMWVIGLAVLSGLLLFLLHPFVLPGYAWLFHKQNATKGADAIICLSGGRITRVPESLRLWNRGFAKQLFVTAEKPKNREFQKLELSHLGFAKAVTRKMDLNATWQLLPSLSGGATSTFDEAEDALALSLEKNWNRIIIVTDEFHTKRAHFAFQKIFEDSGVKVEVAGAPNEIFSIEDWWKSDRGIMAYFGETVKFPVYFFFTSEPKLVRND